MVSRPARWLLLVALVATAAPPGLRSQSSEKPGRGYVTIPFNGNLEDMLRRQFSQKKLQDLLKKLQADLEKMNIDPGAFEQIGKNEFQKLWKNIPPEKIKPLQEQIKGIKKVWEEINVSFRPKIRKRPLAKFPDQKPPAPPPETLERRLGRWTRDLMKDAENSPVGDMLRDSAAWREGLKDFERLLTNPDSSPGGLDLGKLDLPFPKDLKIDLGHLWGKIKGIPLPGLPSVKVPLPDLQISNPFPAINLPGLPSWSSAVGQGAIWVLVILGLGLVLWQVFRRVGRTGIALAGWRLGPWPMNPAQITTRADLIVAFDYLALLCLGPQVRAWNHRAIATSLADQNEERRLAALELAALYEWARYAPEQDPLSDQALARARRDLCLLAGVPAS